MLSSVFVTIATFYHLLRTCTEEVNFLLTNYSNMVAYCGLLAGGYVVALLASEMQWRMVGC